MFRFALRAFLSAVVTVFPFSTSVAAIESGSKFIFRYKDDLGVSQTPGSEQKDITASYVAALGYPFSAKLPMKPEWQDDNWSIVSGTLPAGISFDPATLTFSGKATGQQTRVTVNLVGTDTTAREIGSASATFDVVTITGEPKAVDIYAHTGKYKFEQLDVPAGITVDKWTRLYATPPGVSIIGRNFDGTPSASGNYPVLITGQNYMGETVITYFGQYLVEDGPTFPAIADDVRPLRQTGGDDFSFGAPSRDRVNHAIGKPGDVRYFLEVASPGSLPGTVASNDIASDLRVVGNVQDPFQTAKVRYKAIDSDDTVGFSNWFEFGTSDPQPTCSPTSGYPITWYTNKTIKTKVPTPQGAQGTIQYTLVSGTLPDLVTLNKDSGYYEGTPMKAASARPVEVRIDVVNPEGTVSTTCKYTVEVQNSGLTLADTTPAQDRHIRVGQAYNGQLTLTGGIDPWSVSVNDGETLLPTLSFNPASLAVAGTVSTQALPYQIGFKASNGDGNSNVGKLSVYAHGPLTLNEVPSTLTMKRYENTFSHAFAYDANTVIPDLTTYKPQPVLSLSGNLPDTLRFSGNTLAGGTTWDVGTYGPFQLTMSDYSGDTTSSKPFNIEVVERDPMVAEATNEVSVVVEMPNEQQRTAFGVKQPALADQLKIDWTITGDEPLPSWLSFDQDTGALTAAANIPYADMRAYGPYTITATDSDGSSASSQPFHVTVTDWPTPAVELPGGLVHSNVSGVASSGEDPVFFSGPVPNPVTGTFIGGIKTATFVSTEPDSPAGLDFNPANGQLSGNPNAEFNGPVSIRFKDSKGRDGVGTFNLAVHPYPRVTTADSYDLPRIANAANFAIKPTKNSGFWGSTATWRLSPSSAPLPDGLSVDATSGTIVGRTAVTEGQYGGIVVQATDSGGSGITASSRPFTINVTSRDPFTVETGGNVTFRLNDSETGNYTLNSTDASAHAVVLKGSYRTPVGYQIIGSDPDTLSGLSINSIGILTGFPATLGEWTVTVRATDADGEHADTTVVVKSTLEGYVQPVTGIPAVTVRAGETFQTPGLVVKNYVGTPVFSSSPAALPSSLSISAATGEFYGRIDDTAETTYVVDVLVKDSDGRGFYAPSGSPVRLSASVKPPLELQTMSQTQFTSRQFAAAQPVDITFPRPKYAMGKIRWAIGGDVPGTLVMRNYDLQDNPIGYNWSTPSDSFSLLTDSSGVVKYTINGFPQPLPTSVADDYLPLDALVFDTKDGTLKGIPSKTGTFAGIVATASDTHANSYLEMGDPTRIAYNKATAPAVTITVDAVLPLELAAAQNPKAVIVPDGNANLVPFAKNAAYGKMQSWSLSGGSALPAGITATVGADGIAFAGYSDKLGSYKVTAHGTDVMGRTASLEITFKVVLSTDPIVMSVADIVTKPGYSFTTAAPTTDNTFGNVRFYSNDIATNYPQQMSLAASTGVITGKFQAVDDFYFDLFVTDDTNRVTSKPVHVQIIPYLRLVAPTIATFTQGAAGTVKIDTAYNIGAVAYEMAAGQTLPAGLTLNPTTGEISGTPTAAPGTNPDYVVYGVDSLGDRQPSNAFSIVVNPIAAKPVISDITGNKLAFGTVGTAFNFTPTVKDSVKNQAWVYPATYTINKDLTGTGLTFDATTGVISGTPTSPVYFDDMVVSVSNSVGGSSTTPFVFGIQPDVAMSAAAGQTNAYKYRVGDSVSIAAPVFDNTWGKLTYKASTSPQGTAIAAATGVVSGTAATAAVTNVTITVTDVFGRTAQFTYSVTVNDALTASVASPTTAITQSVTYAAMNQASSNAVGTKTYEVIGLPTGFTYSTTTGAIQGTVPASTYANETQFPIEVWVTDGWDQRKAKATYTLIVADTYSLFTSSQVPAATYNDSSQLSVGVKFKANVDGKVAGIKFYRSVSDKGQNVVDLWTSTGTKLATASFTNTTATGWQTVYFATPVSITANTVYVASYHSTGYYVGTQSGFASGSIVNGPLTATGAAYSYGGTATTGVFPSSASQANYWADVIFLKTP
ncbi:putative Ig domain-containing protein [Rhizobium sp. BK176]|uniref:putative Ig domain-containing protein n=1 Tax=Rhizobium sp. BK176 TaxID=2587071 RepID=UPI0021672F52|nr:putative Ig domain-containing protein [Rhizobium sp. BK176]MCS4089099.1 hypothetical protein [Rhizobium sp. BK176]